MEAPIIIPNEVTADYISRNNRREVILCTSTMNFVSYFISLGDTEEQAKVKVSELSTEVAQYLYCYVLGNKTPLINSINASTLPFMDASAKAYLISQLEIN